MTPTFSTHNKIPPAQEVEYVKSFATQPVHCHLRAVGLLLSSAV